MMVRWISSVSSFIKLPVAPSTPLRSNLLNGVEGATGNFMKLLAEAEEYNKRVVNGTSPKTVSNTNSNPEAIPFLNALGVNGGKQVKTEWDGLGFNLRLQIN